MKPVSLVIIGAGSRGGTYAQFARAFPERARVVGVAEPRPAYREALVNSHEIPLEHVFVDWRDAAARPRFADAAVIATQDADHQEPALAFAKLGYHILLEKPMAPTAADCRRIAAEAPQPGAIFAVCHVLRYTAYTRTLKALVAGGLIGKVVNIQRLEPVGFWHQAHSFVRGNWRREDESSPMLLAKCSHDLDWIRHLVGSPCRAVHSFGSLIHFRAEEKPPGAGSRCLDCEIEPACPYSAARFYLSLAREGKTGWPLDVLTPEPTEARVREALREGPYGRCVYECDNDVVDNQVVNMQFENGATASLTMTAFTEARPRLTRIFGTRGELEGDGVGIRHFDFLEKRWREIPVEETGPGVLAGHGGGDFGLMSAFVDAVAGNDPGKVLSGPEETLETHLMVFAAERSRREERVVLLEEMR